ncbi:MAG: helix-turn-helix domain-containing protein, partial [Beijerinckiaceae bacterium]
MSIRVLSDVFDHFPAGGNELLLALAIADFAADDGTRIYPGVATLAAKTRLSKRTVQYMLRDLEERGWLERVAEGGGLRAAEYRINPRWIAARGNYVLRDPKAS